MANNGIAYGFIGQRELFAERVTTVGVEVVQTSVMESLADFQREQTSILSIFTQRVTFFQKQYQLPTGGTLQPLDEWGNPLPVEPSGYYQIALPIQGGGTAWGDNRVSRAKMTVEDANRLTWMVQTQDMDWMVRHILAAIFTNVTWTYPDKLNGNLTIQPLANADTVLYAKKGLAPATDTHFLAQAATIADGTANPFPTIYTELDEHPSNSGDIISYCATNIIAAIKVLTNFIPAVDGNVRLGVGSDSLTRTIDPGVGDKVWGYVDGCWIVEWKRLPDSYIVSISAGADPVVGMREHEEAELQGLFPEFQDIDGGRHLNKFIRYAGFGIMNRVGACVMRVGNGSYAVPTGYLAPLPV